MRLRNVRGARQALCDSKYVIDSPQELKGKWHNMFENDNPIHIEIGMGKGKFLHKLAIENPDINYIGIEKFSSVLIRALEKREAIDVNNLFYIRMDAESIVDIFSKNEVNRIYLNFSDPWPKDKHAKRRLTSGRYFSKYNEFLSDEGMILFKTDNKDLFDFSVEEIKLSGWFLNDVTYDLHKSEYLDGNVMTEYEEKFVELGKPICRLVAYKNNKRI